MIDQLNHTYAVILAGGYGTRFWPKSRKSKPKQLCVIGANQKTLLEQTLDRLEGIIPPARRIIVTNSEQEAATRAIVKDRVNYLIPEACSRNTAPAILLAALLIKQISPARDASVMISLHADHAIADVEKFIAILRQGVSLANQNQLVLLGCIPTSPATGYGYIKRGAPLSLPGAFTVDGFVEKPNLPRAQAFLASGDYYWNSGIFFWNMATILGEFQRSQPKLLALLSAAKDHRTIYAELPSVSIDEGIIELSSNVVVIESAFGWNDIGSWSALASCFPRDQAGNVKLGDVLAFDCKNTIMESSHPFVAALGVENLVIVATKDAVLICPQDRTQEVKRIVVELERQKRSELL